ncbi:MAG: hypothetical protein K2W94_07075 [Alphaproteobacteria bacterium]|nr:hypothetical protein [Alphaproteobacteria bacterium]
MIFFLIIFWLVTPGFCMDEKNDPDLQWVLAESRQIYDQKADRDVEESIKRSMDPAHNVKPDNTLLALIEKAKRAKTKAEYLSGLNLENQKENLIGYMTFLNVHSNAEYLDLVLNLNRTTWDSVYQSLGLGKRTANNVFILLDNAKSMILEELDRQQNETKNLVTAIDYILLDLLSGKWGFSKKKSDAGVLKKLKEGAKRIGEDFGNLSYPLHGFVQIVFGRFDKGMLASTQDPLLRRHRLSAFSYIANGYLESFENQDQEIDPKILQDLVRKANPSFTPDDLKGFSLGMLVEYPRETMKKINKTSEISSAQQVAFNKFTALLKGASPDELVKLRAFLSVLGEIPFDDEVEGRSIELLCSALQGKNPAEIKSIITPLRENDLLSEAGEEIEQIFIEAARYNKNLPVEKIYMRSMKWAIDETKETKGETEPKPNSHTKVFSPELKTWLGHYFDAIHQLGYGKRDAYLVTKKGFLQGEVRKIDEEVTDQQYLAASKQAQAYEIANKLKKEVFGDIKENQRAMLYLTDAGVDIVLIENGKVSKTETQSRYRIEVSNLIDLVKNYGSDPNEPAPVIEKTEIVSEKPLKPQYAVMGGEGIVKEEILKSHGLAIDALISEGIIDPSLKLAMLLYMYDWDEGKLFN